MKIIEAIDSNQEHLIGFLLIEIKNQLANRFRFDNRMIRA